MVERAEASLVRGHLEVVRAALLTREADFRGLRESAVVGLELLDQALAIYATLPTSADYVRALEGQIMFLDQLGRFDDGYRVAKSAAEASAQVGSPQQHRRILAWLAWHEAEAGHLARALHTAGKAHAWRRLVPIHSGT